MLHKEYIKKSGKEQEEIFVSASRKKLVTIRLSDCFTRTGFDKRAVRVRECGTRLHFKQCENGHKFLHSANFCKDRLCPLCAWRRSRKIYREILEILHVASERFKMRFLFLTLTVRNVSAEELPETLTQMFTGYRDLMALKAIDKNMIGWIRNLEITVKDGSYHPHFHCILAVRPSYFNGANSYIKQKEWTSLWQHSAKLDYIPIVHVQAVKPKRREGSIESAVAETAKYSVKDSDYIRDNDEETDEIVSVLATALHSRRLIGFGKAFRKIRAELKHNEGNLNEPRECGENCPICNTALKDMLYEWSFKMARYIEIE